MMSLELSMKSILFLLRIRKHCPEDVFETTLILAEVVAGQGNLARNQRTYRREGLLRFSLQPDRRSICF